MLAEVFAAAASAGAVPLAHCCAADVPAVLLTDAGAEGLSVDLGVLAESAYDEMATLLEKGASVLPGVVPSTDPDAAPGEKALVERVLRFLDMHGFDPEAVAGHLEVTPACGLAGASPAWALEALRLVARSASSFDA
jgi:hypothetical protein